MTSSVALLRTAAVACGAAAVCLSAAPSQAQYKVVGPDGKVTYTDRAPAATEGRVVPLGSRARVEQAAEPEVPFELRQVTAKYPVTLYTVTGACEPCNTARTSLRQRGIPFAERQVLSPEDSEALEKLSGAREAPVVTIGAQMLRGYSPEVWSSYLDAAGYPRASKLPSTWAWSPATPIVQRPQATTQAAAPAAPATPAPATPQPAGTGGIRF